MYRITGFCNAFFSEDFSPTNAQWTMFLHVRLYVPWILAPCTSAMPVRDTDIPKYWQPPGPSQRRSAGYHHTRQSGDVAQLAEHLLCKQGVGGSNPLVSTAKAQVSKHLALELPQPGSATPAPPRPRVLRPGGSRIEEPSLPENNDVLAVVAGGGKAPGGVGGGSSRRGEPSRSFADRRREMGRVAKGGQDLLPGDVVGVLHALDRLARSEVGPGSAPRRHGSGAVQEAATGTPGVALAAPSGVTTTVRFMRFSFTGRWPTRPAGGRPGGGVGR